MTHNPTPVSGEPVPDGWKSADEFAAGIDGNRLPAGETLAGTRLTLRLADGELVLDLGERGELRLTRPGRAPSVGWYELVEARPDAHFLTVTDEQDRLWSAVVMTSTATGRALVVESRIAPEPTPGRPRVSQTFAVADVAGRAATGEVPGPTRDLIGWRALYRYSPHHLYEHVYLSSERYAWQCLAGEQRGHGDVDLATTYKLADGLYVFTFREFVIPVAATWLYDLDAMRTTGTFFGLAADGTVLRAPGGAQITDLGRVAYPDEVPV